MPYGSRFSRPLGVDNKGFGGAGLNLGIEALAGDTDLVTVFDDFNVPVPTTSFGAAAAAGSSNPFEDCGWTFTDVGAPVADEVGIMDPADVNQWHPSCVRIFTGTADDAGGNMQLNMVTPLNSGIIDVTDATNLDATRQGRYNFPHLWVPETAAGAAVMDNHVFVFACRVGLQADETGTGTDWNSKAFIGWAEAGDTNVMTAATGVITIASTGPLVGFHIPEDGSVDAVSHRSVGTAMAEGTNFTELLAAGSVDNTVAAGAAAANDIRWFDLALRMTVTDQSDNAANGFTEFFYRQVRPQTWAQGQRTHSLAGDDGVWVAHPTVLTNQTPNNDVALVPTIEVINGPTAGRDGAFYLDWWTFGVSRFSRR